jgi:hypothetical protein
MKLLRSALVAMVALFFAGLLAAGIRLSGKGGTPPQHGGWKELELPPEPQ